MTMPKMFNGYRISSNFMSFTFYCRYLSVVDRCLSLRCYAYLFSSFSPHVVKGDSKKNIENVILFRYYVFFRNLPLHPTTLSNINYQILMAISLSEFEFRFTIYKSLF